MKLNPALQARIDTFKSMYPTEKEAASRLTKPSMPFYGTDILEKAVTALLEGENLLLCGDKATGKNVLAENLAWIFGRPIYNISFHVNTDSSTSSAQILLRIMKFSFARVLFISVPSTEALVFWMKSIWQKMTRFPCFTLP